jgi:hypothetical protein
MNPNDALHAARSMGLPLPTPSYIFGAILFGLLGFAAWRYGKVIEHPRTRWLGVALMLFPTLVGRTWLLYLVGIALCAGIWWDRPSRH